MRLIRLALAGGLVALVAACVPQAQPTPPAPPAPPPPPPPGSPTISRTTVVNGQGSVVWDLAFVDADTYFFSLRNGVIKLKDGAAAPIGVTGGPTDVRPGGEGGLLGMTLDADFPGTPYLYVCQSWKDPASTTTDNRVVRWTVAPDLGSLSDPVPIITGMPHNDPAGGRHSGCRPRFKPGTAELWIGTGDAAIGTTPQDPMSLGGKVLRVDRDGNGLAGNPGVDNPGGGLDPRIHDVGHRNVQGLAFRPTDHVAYSAEHGPGTDDEINKLVSGANYGWNPVPLPYNEGVPMTASGATPAVWKSGTPTVAPSGMTFLSGAQWESWDGALAVALLKNAAIGERLRIMFMNAAGTVTSTYDLFVNGGQRLRTAVQAPDGSLYVGTDHGEIWRVVPS